MTYQWKTPIYPNVSAQDAGEHIEELCNKHGSITAKLLLDDSRPVDAVLHPCYEWDDLKAAEKYRLHQSKQIIGNLVTIEVVNNQPIAPTVAFVTINDRNKKAEYQPVEVALSDEESKYQVMKNAVAELKMFQRKYQKLLDLAKLLEDFLRGLSA